MLHLGGPGGACRNKCTKWAGRRSIPNCGQSGEDWAAMGHVKVVKSSPYFSRFQTKVRATAQPCWAEVVRKTEGTRCGFGSSWFG